MMFMQRAIEVLPSSETGYKPFKVEVKAPGTLRRILTAYEPPSTIIAASTGKPPEAEMKAVPALVFEVDPHGEMITRSYVWLPGGAALNYPGTLEFRESYVDDASGMPLLLYEVMAG